MLSEVADGVWVRQSEWVWSNAIVVRGDDGLVLVDPGIDGSDLEQLADDVDGLGLPVVAGFSTHPHWDHLLWHARFGDVPRYATAACADTAAEARERAQAMAAQSAEGIPLDLVALTPLPADGRLVPGTIIEHEAHALGHAAVLLADRSVLLAGDMLSDVLIPMLDPASPRPSWPPTRPHSTGWARPPSTSRWWSPGHGAVAEGPEVAARLAADRAYLDTLRGARNRSTRAWSRTGWPARTSRTWSSPDRHRAESGGSRGRRGLDRLDTTGRVLRIDG